MTGLAKFVFLFIFLTIAPSVRPQSIMKLADQYNTALKRVEKHNGRASLEVVLRKGTIPWEKFEELSNLSEANYSRFKKKMRGFVVGRDEIMFVEPDVKFFYQRARKKGTKADTRFFVLLEKLKPDNVWRAFIEQQTDVTGCTKYGNGLLKRLYGELLRFKKGNPGKYVVEVKNEIDEILAEFSIGGCACGNLEGVLREFKLFVRSYPKDPNTPQIKRNLTQIKKRGDFRPNCHSG